jgi:hypothetical protein
LAPDSTILFEAIILLVLVGSLAYPTFRIGTVFCAITCEPDETALFTNTTLDPVEATSALDDPVIFLLMSYVLPPVCIFPDAASSFLVSNEGISSSLTIACLAPALAFLLFWLLDEVAV